MVGKSQYIYKAYYEDGTQKFEYEGKSVKDLSEKTKISTTTICRRLNYPNASDKNLIKTWTFAKEKKTN